MVYEKASINWQNNSTSILKIKDITVEFSIFNIADWWCFYSSFYMFINEVKVYVVDTAYNKLSTNLQYINKVYPYF